MRTKHRITYHQLTAYVILASTLSLTACQRPQSHGDTPPPPIQETLDLPLQDPTARVITLKQVDRQTLTQEVLVPETAVFTDVFKQQETIPPSIDILIVIDNSLSMEEEQLNLSDKLSALLSDLSEVEWQINVITTDNYCQRLPELPLTAETEDMESIFLRAVRAGIAGSGYEMALARALDHLQGKCTSDPPWKRENTDLALLIVSDEDEDSYSSYYEQAELFLSEMEALGYIAGTNFKTYGIVGHPEKPCPTAWALAVTYADVIDLSDGIWGSICDPNYGPTLAAISRDIRLNLKTDFPLRFAPILTTITLQLDGSAYSGDWTVVGQRIILAESLPEGSTLIVTYQVESFRLIPLGVDSNDYILDAISINDTPLDPASYRYDQTSNSILLTFDPKAGDMIKTSMVENKPLKVEYPFPDTAGRTVNCYLGNKQIDSQHNAERRLISIDPPLPPSAVAHCLY